jgi:hypothetical protein
MLIEHHLSHLTQGSVFSFYNTILGRRIRTRKLVFKTQVMAKGFEMRVLLGIQELEGIPEHM